MKIEDMKTTGKNVLLRLSMDSEYLKKAKKSICKDCENSEGWLTENYLCKIAENNPFSLDVEYKEEGVFHTQIIKCNMFEERKKEQNVL